MAPSVTGGAVVPLAVYYLVRPQVSGDAQALMIAGAFPACWIAVQWVRKRWVDPIAVIILFAFVAGVITSVALGDNAFVLKVREAVVGSGLGLACLASLHWGRPIMFFIGRALSTGGDPAKIEAYDELWGLPTGPRIFAIITAVWGIGLIIEACVRVPLALVLATGPFLAVVTVESSAILGGVFAFTVWYSRRALRLAKASMAEATQAPRQDRCVNADV